MTRPAPSYSSRARPPHDDPRDDASFDAFRTVLSAYIVEQKSLSAVRRELTRCVAASHDRAVSMLHYLRAANEAGLVNNQAMHALVNDIRFAVETADRRERKRITHPRAGTVPGTDTRKLLAGRYEICQRIGKGGIGEVYLARDLQRVAAGYDDPRVAIKVIQRRHSDCPEAVRSLQREAVNAQCLVHRGIRRVYALDRVRQRFFLVMEWLDGETLAKRLDRTRGRPMATGMFQTVLLQIASALSFAHSHGIVHGDIKPGNVFMSVKGESKLLDFGHTEGVASLSGVEPFAFTRGYSSLEVCRGAQPTVQDDVYSLSIMAYRMLVGFRPFGRYTAIEVNQRGLRPERPATLDLSQWDTLRAGLAPCREHRPATVLELCNGLIRAPVELGRRPRLVIAA